MAIKKRDSNFCSRVRMVNTYLTPCMGYLVRFKLILKSITSLMWKFICSALGAYANIKTSIFISCYPPLNSNLQLHHFIVFNWTLLTSCPSVRRGAGSTEKTKKKERKTETLDQNLYGKDQTAVYHFIVILAKITRFLTLFLFSFHVHVFCLFFSCCFAAFCFLSAFLLLSISLFAFFVIFWLVLLAFYSLLLLSSSFVAFFLLWLLC